MRKRLVCAALACLLSTIAAAQNKDTVPVSASKEDVLKFMDVLHLRSQLTLYLDGVAKQARAGAEDGFRQKVPNATPEQLAEVDKFAEDVFKDMPVNEMLDAMVPIYQKHLAKDDIDGILLFYASPVGQKLQREQPAMMQEGMEVGGEIGRRRIGAMIQRMDEFIAKMAEQERQKKSRTQQ